MTLEAGSEAPDFALKGLDGETYRLSEALEDGPALLVFFKAGCETCDMSFPYIETLRRAYGSVGWSLSAISQNPASRTEAYVSELGVECTVLLDTADLEVSTAYDPPATPTFYLVAPTGEITATSVGFSKAELNEISRDIAGMLGREAVEIAPEADGNPPERPGCSPRQRMPRRRLGAT